MDGFWREMARLGKDPLIQTAWPFLQFVGVAETAKRRWNFTHEPAEYFYGGCSVH